MKLVKNHKKINSHKIQNIIEIISGGTPSSKEPLYYSETGIPWIGPADINNENQKYIEKGESNISALGLKNSSAKIIPPNTVMVSCRAPVGKTVISKNEITTNQGMKSLVIKDKNLINYEYLYYLMSLKRNNNKLKRHSDGTTFKEISTKSLKKLSFPFHEKNAQDLIAKILSNKEKNINNLKTLIEKLEKRNQYYANKLLSGELRIKEDANGNIEFYKNPDDNWKEEKVNGYLHKTPMKIPKDWCIVKLKDFINLQKGCSIKSELFNYEENGLQFLRTGDVWDDASSKKEPAFFNGKVEDKFIKKEDDFLFCFEGYNTKINKGTVGLLTDSLEGIVSSHLYKINNNEKTKYYSIFLLKNYYIQNLILRQGMGTTVLSATKSWKNLEFILPKEKSEIDIINHILKNQINEIKTIKKAIKKEKTQFDWLSEKLLSGEYIIEE